MDEGKPINLLRVYRRAKVACWVYETDEPGHMHERVHIWLGTMPDGDPRWWVHHTGAPYEGPDRVYPDEASARRGVDQLAAHLMARRAAGCWYEMDPATLEVNRRQARGLPSSPAVGDDRGDGDAAEQV